MKEEERKDIRDEAPGKKCASCGALLTGEEAIPCGAVVLCRDCFEIVESSRDTH